MTTPRDERSGARGEERRNDSAECNLKEDRDVLGRNTTGKRNEERKWKKGRGEPTEDDIPTEAAS